MNAFVQCIIGFALVSEKDFKPKPLRATGVIVYLLRVELEYFDYNRVDPFQWWLTLGPIVQLHIVWQAFA